MYGLRSSNEEVYAFEHTFEDSLQFVRTIEIENNAIILYDINLQMNCANKKENVCINTLEQTMLWKVLGLLLKRILKYSLRFNSFESASEDNYFFSILKLIACVIVHVFLLN